MRKTWPQLIGIKWGLFFIKRLSGDSPHLISKRKSGDCPHFYVCIIFY